MYKLLVCLLHTGFMLPFSLNVVFTSKFTILSCGDLKRKVDADHWWPQDDDGELCVTRTPIMGAHCSLTCCSLLVCSAAVASMQHQRSHPVAFNEGGLFVDDKDIAQLWWPFLLNFLILFNKIWMETSTWVTCQQSLLALETWSSQRLIHQKI